MADAGKDDTHAAASPPAAADALQAAHRGTAQPSAAMDSLRSHYTVESLENSAPSASAARSSTNDAASDNPFTSTVCFEAGPVLAGSSGDAKPDEDGVARASGPELEYSSGDSWVAAPPGTLQGAGSGQQASHAGMQMPSAGVPAHAAAPAQIPPGSSFLRAEPSSHHGVPEESVDPFAASMSAAMAPQLHAGQHTGQGSHMMDAGPASARWPVAPGQLSADPSSDTLPTNNFQQAAEPQELDEDEWDDFAWPEETGHSHTEAACAPGAAADAVGAADSEALDHANKPPDVTSSMEGYPGQYAENVVQEDAVSKPWTWGE